MKPPSRMALAPPRLKRPALPVRPVAPIARPALPAVQRAAPPPARRPQSVVAPRALPARPSPYVDFLRRFTPEGGVEFTYKDIDERWRWIFLRWTLWLGAMSLAAWYAFTASPLGSPLLNILLLGLMGIACWLVVMKPVHIYRHLEVRPDALLIGRSEVFFRSEFELSWPQFAPDGEGNLVLRGVTGTRAVDYLTVRRFDEHDRAPEVLAAHVRSAMQQLWSRPSGT